jgi:tight adherence protein C
MSSSLSAAGALAGGVFGVGVLLMVAGAPITRGIDLSQRIAPYLDQAPRRSRLLLDPAVAHHRGLLAPFATRAAALVDRLLGGRESVHLRLQRAGLAPDVEGFRIQQVIWGIGAGILAAAAGSLLWWTRGASLGALAVVVGCATLGGVMVRDWVLSRAAERRERRLMAEFPALAELLALAVTAGESTPQALERITRLSGGELAAELELCLAQTRTGTPLVEALQGVSRRTGLAPLTRFVDGIVVAVQRGTPLGEVLRAQAQDAREAARQALIEEGGKREIAMMVPVVFLVLPVTVLFAVYPGLSMLRVAL